MVFNSFMDKLCRMVFLKETVTLPTNYYLGFSTTAPTSSGGNISEPSTSAGYKRVLLSNLKSDGDGIAYNEADIDCGEATSAWGTLSWCILYDGADSGASPLSAAKMVKTITVDAGETLKLKAGNVKLFFGEAQVTT